MSIETSITDARENLAQFCDKVVDECETVIIKRKGRPAVALISVEELEGLREAAQILSSPKAAERLLRAYNRAMERTEPPTTVEELRKEFGLAPKRK